MTDYRWPWYAERDQYGKTNGTVCDNQGAVIAEAISGEAAVLIAAAPELLVALEQLLGWIEEPDFDSTPSSIDVSRAAIAKAKGCAQ